MGSAQSECFGFHFFDFFWAKASRIYTYSMNIKVFLGKTSQAVRSIETATIGQYKFFHDRFLVVKSFFQFDFLDVSFLGPS